MDAGEVGERGMGNPDGRVPLMSDRLTWWQFINAWMAGLAIGVIWATDAGPDISGGIWD